MTDEMTATSLAARVNCEIRATSDDSGGKLDAVILATGPVAGTFTFTVRKRSGSGPTTQSGDFKVEGSSLPRSRRRASLSIPAKPMMHRSR